MDGTGQSDGVVSELVTQAEKAFVRGEAAEGSRLLGDAAKILMERGEIDAAINLCENAKDYHQAAALSEQSGDQRRAAQLYLKAGDLMNSARVRLAANEPMMAADLYEQASAYLEAARIYEQNLDLVRAATLYDRANEKRHAADLLVRALSGDGSRSIFGGEASEICRRAGVLYAEVGQLELAVRVLSWGGQNVFAGKLMARAGRADDAIDMLASSGDYLAAAEVAREVGNEKRAQQLLASRAEMEGRLPDAAAHYEEAGLFGQAGRLYEYTGEARKAAEAYERAGQFESAAQLYERLGEIPNASRCLRAAGKDADASALVHRSEKAEVQIKAYLSAGDFVNAASAAIALARAGDAARYMEATAFLELVEVNHPNYIRARTMLSQVHSESGDTTEAMRVLQDLFAGVAPGPQHLDALYEYGRLLELQGFLAGARNAYQTAAMFDPHHKDVGDRMHAIRESDSGDMPSGSQMKAIPIPTLPMVVGGPPPRSTSTMAPIPFAQKPGSSVSSVSVPALPPVDDLSLEPVLSPVDPSTVNAEVHPSFAEEEQEKAEPSTMDLIDEQIEGLTTNDLPPPPDFDKPFPEQPRDELGGVVLRGRFRIERLIGKGAQAHVYLARDQVLDREVAIKVLNESIASDEEALERFLSEARLAARVHHAGCIAIFDFGEERGLTFMAMEYFKGRTLKDLVRKKSLNAYLALKITRDVASALGAVHEAGIVHRDVKPTNVMVDRNGRVRLTDFGVASNVGDEKAAGMMVGTMRYMAPEQARGKEVDSRADIFSMGVVLYEMLAGTPPFGGTLDDLIKRVTKPAPPLPEGLDVPRSVHSVLARCMQRKPEKRYSTVEDLIDDLNSAIREYKKERKKRKKASQKASA